MAKRKARGEGMIRKRSDGRWEYRYYDKAGKAHYVYAKTQGEVRDKKIAIQAELQNGTYSDPDSSTVAEWADYFFDHLYLQPNPDTRASVSGHIRNHIKPFFGKMKLQDVDVEDIRRFHKFLLEPTQKDRKAVSVKTAKNINGTLYQIFQSAIPKRLKINPVQVGVSVVNQAKKEMRTFSLDEQLLFEQALKDHALCSEAEQYLFRFILLTGMRVGEAVGLDFAHVDFATGTINIHQQLKKLKSTQGKKELPNKIHYIQQIGNDYYLALPKHGMKRQIKPGKYAMGILHEMKRKQLEWAFKSEIEDFNPHGFVFVNELGRHLKAATVLKHFKAVVDSMGIPGMRVHDLRHTYSRNSLTAGSTYDMISECLGHASVDFTKKQYGHFPDMLHELSGQNTDKFVEMLEEKKKAAAKKAAATRGG